MNHIQYEQQSKEGASNKWDKQSFDVHVLFENIKLTMSN